MGRLDDHAKKQIVELRKAGLSFRKIKKVLELDNIRVTPQAIYLFLKRKDVEPALPVPGPHPQPALEEESKRTGIDQAGWDDDRLWSLLQENGAGQHQPHQSGDLGTPHPASGASGSGEDPFLNASQDSPRIVHVTSLSKDGGPFRKPKATCGALSPGAQLGPSLEDNCPVPQQASASSCCPASVTPVVPQQSLNSKGRLVLPPARNPALIVRRKIVGRAIQLQKKANVHNGQTPPSSSPAPPIVPRVQPASHPSGRSPPPVTGTVGRGTQTQEASTQAPSPRPTTSPTGPACPWGGHAGPPTSPHSLAGKLDAVQTEVQKLAQAMQAVLERQCRLERLQEQQQRTQREVLTALQQLSNTVGQEAAPGNQPCAPYGSLVDPSPPLPSFSQFKMELI